MLTLTRRPGERIIIGNNIEVVVLETARGRVQLGIEAPRELTIHRGELVDRIGKENLQATQAQQDTEAADENAIHFPEGIFGMPSHDRFLVCDVAESSNFRALVSCVDPNVQFLVIEAAAVWPGYPIQDAQRVAQMEDQEVAVVVIARIPTDESPATVNLLAPVVISLSDRTGKQIILDKHDFGVCHPLGPAAEARPEAQ